MNRFHFVCEVRLWRLSQRPRKDDSRRSLTEASSLLPATTESHPTRITTTQ